MMKKNIWPIIIIVSAFIAGLAAWNGPQGAVRQMLIAWFILICPGMAVVGLLRLDEALTKIVLAVALSLALAALVSELMLFAHRWSPAGILAVLIVISLMGAIVQFKNAVKTGSPGR